MDEKVFIEQLANKFPEIKDDLLDEDYEGLLTLQIGVFKNATQKAIDCGDFNLVDQYLNYILDKFPEFDNRIENSVILSYIGKLDFKDYPISKFIKQIQENLEEYNQSMYKDEALINFLKSNK